jgi:hypothetical protein
MTELEKIFLTSAVTIVGGLLVYISSQIFSKFLIEPIHELKKAIGDVNSISDYHRTSASISKRCGTG